MSPSVYWYDIFVVREKSVGWMPVQEKGQSVDDRSVVLSLVKEENSQALVDNDQDKQSRVDRIPQ